MKRQHRRRQGVSILQRIVTLLLNYGAVTNRLIIQQLPDVNKNSIPATIAQGTKAGIFRHVRYELDEATGRCSRLIRLNKQHQAVKGQVV
jgi:hypothetical protein